MRFVKWHRDGGALRRRADESEVIWKMAYEMRRVFRDRPEFQFFNQPKPGENVWPHQGCPCFKARPGSFPPDPGRECWYCVFANFHLTQEKALQVGVCQYAERCKGSGRG